MSKIIIVIIAVLSFFVSCGRETPSNASLLQADSLLRLGAVDSAFCVLDGILPQGLRSAEDSACYYLLRAQAAYRLYKQERSIEGLDFSIAYYKNNKNFEEELATAYYYKGMLLYNMGRVKDGVLYLKNAEYIANNTDDLELRHKVFESMVVVNEEADEVATAMRYARKSLAVSIEAKKANWQAHAYNNIAVIHSRMGNRDSSSVYIRKCMSMLSHIQQKDRLFIMNNIGVYLMRTDTRLAKQYFQKIIDIYPMEEAYENLADIYVREGKLKDAELLLEKALPTKDLQLRGEVLYTLFDLQSRNDDYGKALATARKLINLKDSMLEMRNNNNVKAIQAEFDNTKSREKYEQKMTLGVFLIAVLVLAIAVVFFYSRYKTYKAKVAMAMDQMLIKNYEQKVAELQRLGKDKEKEIEQINRRKEKLLDRHRDTLNSGYTLFSEIMSGKTTVLWKKHDFESVIEYYRLVDMEFVDSIEKGYEGLSAKYMFYLILEHIGKSDADIMQIMGLAEVSLRSVRSRINKKKR